MNPGPPGPYDFIMNDPRLKKGPNSKPKPADNGTKQRLLYALGGALVMVILFVLFFGLISSSGKDSTKVLVDIAAQETEIIRLADSGAAKAHTIHAKNLAAISALSLSTNHSVVLKMIRAKNHKLTTIELGSKRDVKIDAALTLADQSNKFDETFLSYLISDLSAYRSTLKKAFDASTNANDKKNLSIFYERASLILDTQTTQ